MAIRDIVPIELIDKETGEVLKYVSPQTEAAAVEFEDGETLDKKIDDINNTKASKEELRKKADESTSAAVVLASESWSDNAQTVQVEGVTADNNIFPSPSGRSSTEIWADCKVLCTGQGDGTLTFTCSETPTDDINVSVVIIG
jgi:hypothetical protein